MTTPSIEDHAHDASASELMSAWTSHHSPSEELTSRTWAAVSARASAGELGPELDPEPITPSPSGALASLRLVLAGLTVAAVVAGAGWGLTRNSYPAESSRAVTSAPDSEQVARSEVEPTLEPAATPSQSSPAETSPSPVAVVPSQAPELASGATASITTVPAEKPRPRPRASKQAKVDSLELEMQLLTTARVALKAGDMAAALAALDDHAKQFPHGALAAERELSRITTLCKAGRLDDAEATARRFSKAHPGSTQTKRLTDTCIGDRL